MTTLLVASPGGHVDELRIFADRIDDLSPPLIWVTASNRQTRTVLGGRQVEWVKPIGSRHVGRAVAALPAARQLIRRHRPELVVSTGAALSVPYLLVARLAGIETHFIDSATRLEGPSLTGRIMARIPGVQLHCQEASWAGARWHDIGSVFDAFKPVARGGGELRRVVVSLGGERFGFRRALTSIKDVLPESCDVLWQTGNTACGDLLPSARPHVAASELRSQMRQADLVITHAGVGSVLAALDAGRVPVILARRREYGEHVDDHQLELAARLGRAGLAVTSEPADLSLDHLLAATRVGAVRLSNGQRCHLRAMDGQLL